jgi:hypothetical protein
MSVALPGSGTAAKSAVLDPPMLSTAPKSNSSGPVRSPAASKASPRELLASILRRRLQARGATCYVIAPRKLDEQGKRVKTAALDAGVPERKRRKAVTASEMLRCDPWR